jgi:NTE family protein
MKKIICNIYSTLLMAASLLMFLGCGCPQRFVPTCDPDPLPTFYVPKDIRVALVLGSGGVRGMAHVGVLEVLEKAGIPIDLIVGCSAGSIVAALYADHPCVEKTKKAVWEIKSSSILDIDLWNCRYGLSQGKCMHGVLDKHLCAEKFEELKIPLVVVASDLNSGELIPMGSGDLVKAVQSSCSIPFIFVPCEHMGRVMVDGGTINPVPVKIARDLGAQIIIAVDLCELLERTFPTNLFAIANRSAEIAFMWQNEACTHHADVIIRPKTCGVGTFDDSMKKLLYEAGKRAAEEKLPSILKLLSKLPPKECGSKTWKLVEPHPYVPQIVEEEAEEEEIAAEEEEANKDLRDIASID